MWDVPNIPLVSYSVKITATYRAMDTLTPKWRTLVFAAKKIVYKC